MVITSGMGGIGSNCQLGTQQIVQQAGWNGRSNASLLQICAILCMNESLLPILD